MTKARYDVRCGASGCQTVIGPGKLFCPDHYFALPKGMRDDLWRCWRRAREAWSGRLTIEEQGRRNAAYSDAFHAAKDYLAARRDAPVIAYEDGRPVHYAQEQRL